ncbi:MAG TPA: TonB-dependent receptor [Elusimicrobiota bacterium]|nr:TonB-dependent receptor [Elusimicrobiota bacterium]HMX94334.1 TonB-dependent receptor [Elusimicrobiota bacterium]HMZ27236.1 TonB-dependent receptor [Elusimicrobiota bacterium]HND63541.1 TonB-dependent receptor [Elusimicrobiota bacterium]HNF59924.1 TonB-dependent receptor [Elusimicrobiota bacterium]
MKRVSWTLGVWLITAALFPFSSSAALLGENKRWTLSPKIGFSPFTGVLGAEFRWEHLGLGAGYSAFGVKYYFSRRGSSPYVGPFFSKYRLDHNETIDGIDYDRYTHREVGVSGGYQWQWKSRWNLEVGLKYSHLRKKWEKSPRWREEKGNFIGPAVAAGFAF